MFFKCKKNKHKKAHVEIVTPNTSSYSHCLITLKNATLKSFSTRFPLDKARIKIEAIDGFNYFFDSIASTRGYIAIFEFVITKCLDVLLKQYPDLWADTNQVFDITKLDYQKYFLPVICLALIWAPIMEEVVFRGMFTPLFQNALEKLGVKKELAVDTSVGLSSILFGSAHSKTTMLQTAYMGYESEKLVQRNNGSLWGSMSYHFTNNFFVLTSSLVKKGCVHAFNALSL